jgi:hypothetical protein
LDLVRAQQCFIQVFSSGDVKTISGGGGQKGPGPHWIKHWSSALEIINTAQKGIISIIDPSEVF